MTTPVLALVPAYAPDTAALQATITSLESQDSPVDICVIDDGSPNPVSETLPPRPGLTILRLTPNGGITAALRAGVDYALANGYEYVCRLDVGDNAYPNRVSRQLQYMHQHPLTDLLGAHSRVIDSYGELLFIHGTSGGPEGVRNYLSKNAAFKHSTFFVRLDSLRRFGNYSAGWPVAQDYELALRIARHGGVVDCLDDILIDYIDDPAGLSTRKRNAQLRMRLKAMLAHPAPLEPRWYAGVLRTLVTMITPHGLAKRISLASWGAQQAGRTG